MIRNLGGDALGENPKRFTLGFNRRTGHEDPESSMVSDLAVLMMNIAMK